MLVRACVCVREREKERVYNHKNLLLQLLRIRPYGLDNKNMKKL
jgi:hypothetical protein